MQGDYVHKLTASYATHEGQRTARRRSPSGSAAASAAPASPSTRTIKSGHASASPVRTRETKNPNKSLSEKFNPEGRIIRHAVL